MYFNHGGHLIGVRRNPLHRKIEVTFHHLDHAVRCRRQPSGVECKHTNVGLYLADQVDDGDTFALEAGQDSDVVAELVAGIADNFECLVQLSALPTTIIETS